MNMTKRCSRCKLILGVSCFYKDSSRKGGIQDRCKKCDKERKEERRKRDPDKYRETQRIKDKMRREKYPEKYREKRSKNAKIYRKKYPQIHREKHLKRTYGIDLDCWMKMKDEQSGRCACCGDITEKFVVDHCHDTGIVRSLLCNNCNSALGFLVDSEQRALLMLEYIRNYCKNSITG